MRLRRLLLPAAMIWLLSAPGAASAAGGAEIDFVEPAPDGSVTMLVSVADLPAGSSPDLGSLSVTVDGQPVEATAEMADAGAVSRTTVLALDTSMSMRGTRFAAAKQATSAFLDSAPADLRVGLVTFAGEVVTVSEPTTDHSAVETEIDGLGLSRGTRLYDGITEAVSVAGRGGARSVLVLSDGADISGTALSAPIAASQQAEVKVDVVALQQSAADRAKLAEISGAAGGSIIAADNPESLARVFTAEADALAQQFQVRFKTPDTVDGDADVAVTVSAGGHTYADSAFISLAATQPPSDATPQAATVPMPQAVTAPAPLVGERGLWLGAGALTAGAGAILAMLLPGRRRPQQSLAQRQMQHYARHAQGGAAAATAPAVSALSFPGMRQAAIAVADVVVKRGFESTLSARLTAAGMALNAAEWLLLHVGVAVGAGLVGLLLGGSPLMVLFLLLGAVGPWFYLGLKRSRRLAAFNGQLPETLQLISGGLSAGLSLPQAVDTVVREGSEPMAGEMRRALVEQRLGVDMEDALDAIADRMDSQDFHWAVIAMRIQREVGGNLAELLNTVAGTLREREYLRRQVKTLSAEGRLSAWILGSMPVGMVLYLALVRPDYLRPMYTTTLGWVLSAAALVLLGLGGWAMSKLVKVEV
ncbi:MAG TPA: type II secretion system F family protein [Nocardioidaceae bacterium]|nr:type II secretion system F family protein [Nocardioidaceae bacterium]